MIHFLDGPAKGVSLALRRAPEFLRVVLDHATWQLDALDQLDDEPKASESIYVYRLAGDVGRGFFCRRGKGCLTFVEADYRLFDVQPADEEVRDRERWQAWAMAQAPLPDSPAFRKK